MNAFSIICPNPGCGMVFELDESSVNKKVRCPRCGKEFLHHLEHPKSQEPALTVAADLKQETPVQATMPTQAESVENMGQTMLAEQADKTVLSTEPPSPAVRKEAEDAVAAEWEIGDVILDTYEVKQVHTSGGMGLVYRVHHKGWNLDLAVKSPKVNLFQTESQKENFIKECETWINLGLHPHIVSCHYVRTLGGIPRVFSEYVEGGSLKDWIDNRKLYEGGPKQALKRILDIAIQFAWGLHYAHEQKSKLIHQDVKPDNVLLTEDGTAKVSDFGLAAARAGLGGESEQREPGRSMKVPGAGFMTPEYASPEQAAGKPLTRKTDIWSWAVSVLEMFAGEKWWRSGVVAPEALEQINELRSTDVELPDLPDTLRNLLQACFQNEPEARPKDMAEVAGKLKEIYQQTTGETYLREEPKAAELLADGLNNKAISLIDIGQESEARKHFADALKADAKHLDVTYNVGLLRWRAGEITDEELVASLNGLTDSAEMAMPYLAAVEVERRNFEGANRALPKDATESPLLTFVRRALESKLDSDRFWRDKTHEFTVHRGKIRAVAITPDGHWGLSGGEDKILLVLDLRQNSIVRSLSGHAAPISCVDLSSDASVVVSGGEDGEIRIWNASSGHYFQVVPPDPSRKGKAANDLALLPDRIHLLGGCEDGLLRLWDIRTGRVVKEFKGHAGSVKCVAVSADGLSAASGGTDKSVRIWDIRSGCCLQTLMGHTCYVNGCCFVGDQPALLSAAGSITKQDTIIKLWDAKTGQELRGLAGHAGGINAIVASKDGLTALSCSGWGLVMNEESCIRLWNISSRRCLRTFPGHGRATTTADMSADGHTAITGGADSVVRVWRLSPEACVTAPLAVSRPSTTTERIQAAGKMRVMATEARQLLETGHHSDAAGCVRVARSVSGFERDAALVNIWWALARHARKTSLRDAWPVGFMAPKEGRAPIRSVGLSADGQRLVSCSMDGALRLWDFPARECKSILGGSKLNALDVAVTPDGEKAISVDRLGQATLWNLNSLESVILGSHGKPARSTAVSGNGQIGISVGDDGTIRLWDLASCKCVRVLQTECKGHAAVAISLDGRVIFIGGRSGWMEVWDTLTGNRLSGWKGRMAECVALTGRGSLGITGDLNGIVRVFEPATGKEIATIGAHSRSVWSATIAADSRVALTASADSMIRVWDLITGRCMKIISGEQMSPLRAVQMTRNGRFVVTGDEAGRICIWELDWELDFERHADWLDDAAPLLTASLDKSTDDRGSQLTTADKRMATIHAALGDVGLGWLGEIELRKVLEGIQRSGPPTLPFTARNRFLKAFDAARRERVTAGKRVWSATCPRCGKRSFFSSPDARGKWYKCESCHSTILAGGNFKEFVAARCRCGVVTLCVNIEDPVSCQKCGDFMFVSLTEPYIDDLKKTEKDKAQISQEEKKRKEIAMSIFSSLLGHKKQGPKGSILSTPTNPALGSQAGAARGKRAELAGKLLSMKGVPDAVKPMLERCAQVIAVEESPSANPEGFVDQIEMLMQVANALARAGRQDLGSQVLEVMSKMSELLGTSKPAGASPDDAGPSSSLRDVFFNIRHGGRFTPAQSHVRPKPPDVRKPASEQIDVALLRKIAQRVISERTVIKKIMFGQDAKAAINAETERIRREYLLALPAGSPTPTALAFMKALVEVLNQQHAAAAALRGKTRPSALPGAVSHTQAKLCRCGASNAADSQFCVRCGRPLPQNQPRICPQCGAPATTPGTAFCTRCGAKLEGG